MVTDMIKVVEKTSKAARLNLSAFELQKFTADMEEMLKAFNTLEKVDAPQEASYQPVGIKDAMRKDEPEQCLTQEEALSNTKNKESGFFKGPKVIDK
ncbi:MAG: Asp-tRNA(Asn)/Glu-tRNA(Gln) amidotransferase subunit GatC [Candidatus Aenigmarchaeota archaeon]|nr:Asp-tRNA(Asn)/Glu-tRNA(Gln) amidotransferase subunit GatC [Candidatus Aenigmarchaeota archaeon]